MRRYKVGDLYLPRSQFEEIYSLTFELLMAEITESHFLRKSSMEYLLSLAVLHLFTPFSLLFASPLIPSSFPFLPLWHQIAIKRQGETAQEMLETTFSKVQRKTTVNG